MRDDTEVDRLKDGHIEKFHCNKKQLIINLQLKHRRISDFSEQYRKEKVYRRRAWHLPNTEMRVYYTI
ncbi:hypothetical protein BpHYR1_025785 [Brachionus plicatilis]|uniref:Uncharacterized protein n=1 Tax=Brachionus plicatilis TaxID=10195 RepID=A0A3M7R690_BRAPC|nr:hypothetical protein BpHYR1_025785 [Brachionus plicatilis]